MTGDESILVPDRPTINKEADASTGVSGTGLSSAQLAGLRDMQRAAVQGGLSAPTREQRKAVGVAIGLSSAEVDDWIMRRKRKQASRPARRPPVSLLPGPVPKPPQPRPVEPANKPPPEVSGEPMGTEVQKVATKPVLVVSKSTSTAFPAVQEAALPTEISKEVAKKPTAVAADGLVSSSPQSEPPSMPATPERGAKASEPPVQHVKKVECIVLDTPTPPRKSSGPPLPQDSPTPKSRRASVRTVHRSPAPTSPRPVSPQSGFAAPSAHPTHLPYNMQAYQLQAMQQQMMMMPNNPMVNPMMQLANPMMMMQTMTAAYYQQIMSSYAAMGMMYPIPFMGQSMLPAPSYPYPASAPVPTGPPQLAYMPPMVTTMKPNREIPEQHAKDNEQQPVFRKRRSEDVGDRNDSKRPRGENSLPAPIARKSHSRPQSLIPPPPAQCQKDRASSIPKLVHRSSNQNHPAPITASAATVTPVKPKPVCIDLCSPASDKENTEDPACPPRPAPLVLVPPAACSASGTDRPAKKISSQQDASKSQATTTQRPPRPPPVNTRPSHIAATTEEWNAFLSIPPSSTSKSHYNPSVTSEGTASTTHNDSNHQQLEFITSPLERFLDEETLCDWSFPDVGGEDPFRDAFESLDGGDALRRCTSPIARLTSTLHDDEELHALFCDPLIMDSEIGVGHQEAHNLTFDMLLGNPPATQEVPDLLDMTQQDLDALLGGLFGDDADAATRTVATAPGSNHVGDGLQYPGNAVTSPVLPPMGSTLPSVVQQEQQQEQPQQQHRITSKVPAVVPPGGSTPLPSSALPPVPQPMSASTNSRGSAPCHPPLSPPLSTRDANEDNVDALLGLAPNPPAEQHSHGHGETSRDATVTGLPLSVDVIGGPLIAATTLLTSDPPAFPPDR
ncbi:hypothetical protein HKX48_000453 [Thoreauomyces humboldtii]|nr:hypothetical protein HKX48_000453 [Thoreauomyces humboldtii]